MGDHDVFSIHSVDFIIDDFSVDSSKGIEQVVCQRSVADLDRWSLVRKSAPTTRMIGQICQAIDGNCGFCPQSEGCFPTFTSFPNFFEESAQFSAWAAF